MSIDQLLDPNSRPIESYRKGTASSSDTNNGNGLHEAKIQSALIKSKNLSDRKHCGLNVGVRQKGFVFSFGTDGSRPGACAY